MLKKLNRRVRASLGMSVQNKTFSERMSTWWKGEERPKRQKVWRRTVGPAYTLKEDAGFKHRRPTDEKLNPLEPEYYKKLPDWLRADGAYAPIEVAKIIFYLLIPVFAIIGLGSRNLGWVVWASDYLGDYSYKALAPSYEEQVKGWRKLDEEGMPSHYRDNISMSGSALRKKEEGVEAELEERQKLQANVARENAPSEYFTIMNDLRKQQQEDAAKRSAIYHEVDEIIRESNIKLNPSVGEKALV
ncbi:hypothetical protein DIPPA_20380 [Diplonema papillatum]|nr:hypothetical protein DIPPA_20380 [Diplonema papillatum]